MTPFTETRVLKLSGTIQEENWEEAEDWEEEKWEEADMWEEAEEEAAGGGEGEGRGG